MQKTKVTSKYQTTIPENVRNRLGIKAGSEVGWHIIREYVILDTHKKIKNPVAFLTSQIKASYDAVKLVRETRDDL